MTKVTLVLGENTLEKNQVLAQKYSSQCDLFELRGDYLDEKEWANLPTFPQKLQKPTILTIRLPIDGGVWRQSEDLRIDLFLQALDGPWYAIDLEENRTMPKVEQKAREKGILIIKSFHNFQNIPEDTGERIQKIHGKGFVPKAAVSLNSTEDFALWLQIADEVQNLPMKVFLGMGEFGLPTRLLTGRWNISWTYASPEGQTLAPGQISVTDMSQLFRVQKVNPNTIIYGIIGNPVLHSKSPHFHNPALHALGLDAIYVPFPVSNPEEFWPLLPKIGLQGLSVTIPWKENAAAWAEGQSRRVKAIGACNTLYKHDDKWMGENTDAPGFFTPILERFGEQGLVNRKVTILGNGGAARAAIFEFLEAGAKILVLGRNQSKVDSIIAPFQTEDQRILSGELSPKSTDLLQEHSDLIVQTTPVGMGKLEGKNPLGFYRFKGTELLYDMVYVPEKTAFIKAGIEAGCDWISGKSMLYHQGFRQFALFTGHLYPEDLKLRFLV
jgi:3-dehydroquinate dehydratase/shikimate dehydrogenase